MSRDRVTERAEADQVSDPGRGLAAGAARRLNSDPFPSTANENREGGNSKHGTLLGKRKKTKSNGLTFADEFRVSAKKQKGYVESVILAAS